MGNQLPARCVTPCNPVCCAMCFHADTGRGDPEENHKSGSVFANAASVLSMAAEEIQMDDHLEEELANEVELWRMETSNNAALAQSPPNFGLDGPGLSALKRAAGTTAPPTVNVDATVVSVEENAVKTEDVKQVSPSNQKADGPTMAETTVSTSSSSDEDSFAGFIEDPLEKELAGEVRTFSLGDHLSTMQRGPVAYSECAEILDGDREVHIWLGGRQSPAGGASHKDPAGQPIRRAP